MKVTIRRDCCTDSSSIHQEIALEADGGYSPDVCADLIARTFDLWGWTFEDAEPDQAE